MNRKYLPTFAELLDRMTIVQLKQIFIPENKDAYEVEIQEIMHDIDTILDTHPKVDAILNVPEPTAPVVNAKMIRGIMLLMLTNRYIWENETKARSGGTEQDKLLKLTHSINGVRTNARNLIAKEMGERVDLKVDCLAADLVKEFGNWDIFGSWVEK